MNTHEVLCDVWHRVLTADEAYEKLDFVEIDQLRADLAVERGKVALWVHEFKAAYKRGTEAEIALNAEREKVAQLENTAKKLAAGTVRQAIELAAAQAMIAQMREALESCTPADYTTSHAIHPSFDDALVEQALSIPANLDQLHEDRAQSVESVAEKICFAMNSQDIYDLLKRKAAAHRARKEGK